MKIDLTGKRAIVAGGSRGIGRAIALAFADCGAHVSICARGAETLAAARSEIAAKGVTAHAAPCDLADGEAVARYVAEAVGRSAGSTSWSTMRPALAPAMTRRGGRKASRSICWRRCGGSARCDR